ncbi:MAG: hypothetical protein WC942_01775 [Clostridia bacterium]|jgi:predicted HAD superfamily Cof-like phosphohydrolase
MRSEHQKRIDAMTSKIPNRQPLPKHVVVPDGATRLLRAKLIYEEAMETIVALGCQLISNDTIGCNNVLDGSTLDVVLKPSSFTAEDIIKVADGCADLSVVTIGTLSDFGIDDVELLEEVDQNNLAKFDGDGHLNDYGKWIKPSDHRPPDIAKVLRQQGLDI